MLHSQFLISCSDKRVVMLLLTLALGCRLSWHTQKWTSQHYWNRRLVAPPLDTPRVPPDIGKILMTVLKLYNQEAMAMLTVHSDFLAIAKCQFHFKDEAYKNAQFSPKILYTIQQVKN